MIHRSDSLSGDEGSRCATIVLERLIRGGIQTHPPVRDKTRDAGVADIADHAAGHDLPVAVGGACRDDGANGIGAAAVLSILSTRRAGWRDDGAWHDPGEKQCDQDQGRQQCADDQHAIGIDLRSRRFQSRGAGELGAMQALRS
jgi:hypothetical protein